MGAIYFAVTFTTLPSPAAEQPPAPARVYLGGHSGD